MPDDSLAVTNIVNGALVRLGHEPITQLSENPAMAHLYPLVRDTLLTWTRWTFATTRQALTRLSAAPASEFDYQYALPSDPYVLRTLDIDAKGRRFQKEVYIPVATPTQQQAVILTDADAVVLQYIARVSEAVFPPMFADTLSLWLAMDGAQAITGRSSLRELLQQQLTIQLDRFETIDAHQDSPREIAFNTNYLDVRQRGTNKLVDSGEVL